MTSKMKKRLLALALALSMLVPNLPVYSRATEETTPATTAATEAAETTEATEAAETTEATEAAEETEATEETQSTESTEETEPAETFSVYDRMVGAESLEAMVQVIWDASSGDDDEQMDQIMALNQDELNQLREHAESLPVETEEDEEYLDEILSTIQVLEEGTVATPYAATTYDLWVGGEQFTSEKLTITSANGGTATYDPAQNRLILENYSYTGTGYYIAETARAGCIVSKIHNLTIEVKGTNTLDSAAGNFRADGIFAGIYSSENITIVGDGTLTARGPEKVVYSFGIHVVQNLTIDMAGGTLYTLAGEVSDHNVPANYTNWWETTMPVSGARSQSSGVYVKGDFCLKAGTVTAEGKNSTRISRGLDINNCFIMEGGILNASCTNAEKENAIVICVSANGDNNTATITGGELNITGNMTTDSINGNGLYATGEIVIEDAKTTITMNNQKDNMAIYTSRDCSILGTTNLTITTSASNGFNQGIVTSAGGNVSIAGQSTITMNIGSAGTVVNGINSGGLTKISGNAKLTLETAAAGKGINQGIASAGTITMSDDINVSIKTGTSQGNSSIPLVVSNGGMSITGGTVTAIAGTVTPGVGNSHAAYIGYHPNVPPATDNGKVFIDGDCVTFQAASGYQAVAYPRDTSGNLLPDAHYNQIVEMGPDCVAYAGAYAEETTAFKPLEPRAYASTYVQFVKTYPLWLGGVQVNWNNKDDIASAVTAGGRAAVSGKAAYDPDTSKLTLEGFHFVGYGDSEVYEISQGTNVNVHAAVRSRLEHLTIDCVDEISYIESNSAIAAYWNTTVFATGNLTVTGQGMTIVGPADKAEIGEFTSIGLMVREGNVLLEPTGTLNFQAKDADVHSFPIQCGELIQITSGTVNLTGGNGGNSSRGIDCNGRLEIIGSANVNAVSGGANGTNSIALMTDSNRADCSGMLIQTSGRVTARTITTFNNTKWSWGLYGKSEMNIVNSDVSIICGAQNADAEEANGGARDAVRGIYNEGNITVTGSTLHISYCASQDNYGFGIQSVDHTVTIQDSTVSVTTPAAGTNAIGIQTGNGLVVHSDDVTFQGQGKAIENLSELVTVSDDCVVYAGSDQNNAPMQENKSDQTIYSGNKYVRIVLGYPLQVGGIQITAGNKDNIAAAVGATGTGTFNPSTGVLTLDNFQYSGANNAIEARMNLIIEAKNQNTLITSAKGVESTGSLTIQGGGTLTIDATDPVIKAAGDLLIENAVLIAKGGSAANIQSEGSITSNNAVIFARTENTSMQYDNSLLYLDSEGDGRYIGDLKDDQKAINLNLAFTMNDGDIMVVEDNESLTVPNLTNNGSIYVNYCAENWPDKGNVYYEIVNDIREQGNSEQIAAITYTGTQQYTPQGETKPRDYAQKDTQIEISKTVGALLDIRYVNSIKLPEGQAIDPTGAAVTKTFAMPSYPVQLKGSGATLSATAAAKPGEVYDGFQDGAATVTVLKNGAFTIQYAFTGSYSDVSFAGLPAEAKLILLDQTEDSSWMVFHATAGSDVIPISSFTAMDGSAVKPKATATTFVLCVDLSEISATEATYTISLKDNNSALTDGDITVNLNSLGTVTAFAQGGAGWITATAAVSGVTGTGNSLIVELLDESGNPLVYPAGAEVTIGSETEAVKLHENRAILDGVTTEEYAISIENLPAGNYSLKVSLAQETAPAYPMQEIADAFDTTEAVKVTSTNAAIRATLTSGSRLLPSGGGTVSFSVQTANGAAVTWDLQKKENGSYSSTGTTGTVTGNTASVTIPENETEAAITYRVLFSNGTETFPFNLIVDKGV